MNSTPYQSSTHLSITLKSSHPGRSLAEGEANRQTQSKDPYHADKARDTETSFRVVVRFFDEQEAERRPAPSREAPAWESPARQRGVCAVARTSPEETPPSHKRITQ